jgi:abortive infection alpha-like protein
MSIKLRDRAYLPFHNTEPQHPQCDVTSRLVRTGLAGVVAPPIHPAPLIDLLSRRATKKVGAGLPLGFRPSSPCHAMPCLVRGSICPTGKETVRAFLAIQSMRVLMSDPGNLIPISDEQAKAIQQAIKALRGLGGFLEKTFGTVPQDVVGLLGGDWLKVRRAENIARIVQKAKERLEARHVETPEPASLSLALPLLVAAADESRDELQDLWARLLAAAADPARASRFRLAFIEAVKSMDPLDAGVLQASQAQHGGAMGDQVRNRLAEALHVSRDEVDISIFNLKKLGLVLPSPAFNPSPYDALAISPFGREFLRAVSN